jgi:hypothetical protein
MKAVLSVLSSAKEGASTHGACLKHAKTSRPLIIKLRHLVWGRRALPINYNLEVTGQLADRVALTPGKETSECTK